MTRKNYKDEVTVKRTYDIKDSGGNVIYSDVSMVRTDIPTQVGDKFMAPDANQISDLVEYIPVVVDGTITTQLNLTTYAENKRIPIQLDTLVTGGNITIKKNTDVALPLYADFALTEPVTELEPGVMEIVGKGDPVVNFFLAPKGGGTAIKRVVHKFITIGSGSTSNTVGLGESFDLTKCTIENVEFNSSSTFDQNSTHPVVDFQSDSVAIAERFGTGGTLSISFDIVEYENLKSPIQRVSGNNNSNTTESITTTELAKTQIKAQHRNNSAQGYPVRIRQTNVTTVSLTVSAGSVTYYYVFFVVESK